MKHIMIDMETLSTDSHAVVITIGLVQFDLATGEIGRTLEVHLDILEQSIYKGIIDNSTLIWWSNQDDKAKQVLLRKRGQPILKVLKVINDFIDSLGYNLSEMKLWGNGATFDNVIVRNLYKRHGETFILPYWCDRDVRTIVDLGEIDTRDFKFDGVKHSTIDDCLHQINYCKVAYTNFKGTTNEQS